MDKLNLLGDNLGLILGVVSGVLTVAGTVLKMKLDKAIGVLDQIAGYDKQLKDFEAMKAAANADGILTAEEKRDIIERKAGLYDTEHKLLHDALGYLRGLWPNRSKDK